jgi:hypothetical protein
MNVADAQGDLAGTNVEDPTNPGFDYGPCGSDYRNIENVTLVTRSNFHFGNRFNSLLLNGWEFAPLIHIESGSVVNVSSGQDNSFTDVGHDRPNRVPGVPLYLHLTRRSGSGAANRGYLNPAAFAQVTDGCPTPLSPSTCAGYGTYGNLRRNSFRGPSNFQFDAQISRIFPIHESLNATLRLEAFNVLNHPSFDNPTSGLTSSTFGQISGAHDPRIFQGSVKIKF